MDRERVAILGCDASPAVLRLIRDGTMAASVEQSASGQARTALRGLVARIRGQGAAGAQVVAPVLITAANLQQAEHAAAEF